MSFRQKENGRSIYVLYLVSSSNSPFFSPVLMIYATELLDLHANAAARTKQEGCALG